MAKYTRLEVVQAMHKTGVIPLFYEADSNLAKAVIKACYDGGARVIEYTVRGDFAYDVFKELITYAQTELPNLILGVGSITDAGSASRYMEAGANFIVTPVFRDDIAKVCNRRKVLWSPGCGSLTEIAKAEELGCEIIKLFPGSIYGPQFIKAIKDPQPWTSIMPTGGVEPSKDNLKKWFEAGATCVGMGSKLIKKDENGNYDVLKITSDIKTTLNIINEIRA